MDVEGVELTPAEQASLAKLEDKEQAIQEELSGTTAREFVPEPELIAGKFKTHEELLNAYKELEKKLGTSGDKAPEETTNKEPEPGEQPPAVTPELFNEYAFRYTKQNGKLSETDYEELKAKGFSKDVVDGIIAGELAKAEKQRSEILKEVGGSEHFEKVLAWATETLDADTLAAYNASVASGDINVVKFSIKALATMYNQANKQATRVRGTPASDSAVQGFASQAEVIAAMSDPRYKKDPAYREWVYKRIAKMS